MHKNNQSLQKKTVEQMYYMLISVFPALVFADDGENILFKTFSMSFSLKSAQLCEEVQC